MTKEKVGVWPLDPLGIWRFYPLPTLITRILYIFESNSQGRPLAHWRKKLSAAQWLRGETSLRVHRLEARYSTLSSRGFPRLEQPPNGKPISQLEGSFVLGPKSRR